MNAAYTLRQLLADYREGEDLVNIGAYQAGSNPKIDRALAKIDAINDLVKQDMFEKEDLNTSLRKLHSIVG